MAEKILNTRLRLKYDTWSEWVKVENTFVPLKGEVCIIDVPAETNADKSIIHEPAVLFKVGDGAKTFKALPFVSALAGDVPAWAKRTVKADGTTPIEEEAFATALADIENLKAFFESSDGSGETFNILDKLSALEATVGGHTTSISTINGTLAELAAADTALKKELQAEIDADVKIVADELAIVKETANNAAVKADVDVALANRYTKTEADKKLSDALANYTTTADQQVIDAEQDRRIKVIEDSGYLVEADIANFETIENVKKVADDLADYISSNNDALAGVQETAEAARTEEEVDAQIDAKITALDLDNKYEEIGAEERAREYVDEKFTEANLDQYTTAQEVKDIVDGVIASAADDDTYNSLTKLVDYIDKHGGDAANMAEAIETLEGQVEVIEGKPAYGITSTQISNWDNEVGAKALAETKITAEQAKTQIEAYGYATTTYADNKAADAQRAAEATAAGALTEAKTAISAEIDADVKIVADELAGYKTSNNERVAAAEAEIEKKANSEDLATVATSGSAYDLIESGKDVNKTPDGDVEVDCFIFYGGSASELVKDYRV